MVAQEAHVHLMLPYMPPQQYIILQQANIGWTVTLAHRSKPQAAPMPLLMATCTNGDELPKGMRAVPALLLHQDNTLWQGESGTNNPCPSGFRLPTEAEWEAERGSWATNNAAGAFGSVLKLTVGGYRGYGDGSLNGVGSGGLYWSSTVSGIYARYLSFDSSTANVYANGRAYGFSVRCIKD
jgi:hypothetical protein